MEMDRLLTAAEGWLARPRSLHSGPWIAGMPAFHNLPRPFWRERRGLWEPPFPPMPPEDALLASRETSGAFGRGFPFFAQ